MKHINTTLAIIALASSSAAFAAVSFDTFDTDGDGVISQKEASVNAQLVEIFSALDTDQNGELSKEEFSKVQ
ncbi:MULTISPECIES: EF-hand domain-containing protein [unclassified Pseudoalteromonas]|uniref:EF-hand domain-containing protein n=1 Tax=unclassified Pseudoalteromonas TaxID=194690 RepID=UPI000B3CC9E0|nr:MULTISPECIES: EF-hand domain-containing protein [unclassified Pseudoalteromonas]MDN3380502.1 EF-hand domain-containing protein [Pseudoalteromonas sp. APC 3893]MDN3388926.1 EF-hand domain-containing protein [Pseudoalteromonas sp. APC 4017]OUS69287.1 calmodulin [Pseudoalteromonas sp. A601]